MLIPLMLLLLAAEAPKGELPKAKTATLAELDLTKLQNNALKAELHKRDFAQVQRDFAELQAADKALRETICKAAGFKPGCEINPEAKLISEATAKEAK